MICEKFLWFFQFLFVYLGIYLFLRETPMDATVIKDAQCDIFCRCIMVSKKNWYSKQILDDNEEGTIFCVC